MLLAPSLDGRKNRLTFCHATMMILQRNCLDSSKYKNSIFHRKHLRLGIKCRISGGFWEWGNIDGNKGNKFLCVWDSYKIFYSPAAALLLRVRNAVSLGWVSMVIVSSATWWRAIMTQDSTLIFALITKYKNIKDFFSFKDFLLKVNSNCFTCLWL